ncbi:hypothetical protein [Paraburkholderia sp.]|uniref:hypothetical protein n=1 Tax=Paraburkholderia sp. TaxID=1926495 RepID=UPI003D6F9E1A
MQVFRGIAKVVFIVFACNQILIVAFGWMARQFDANVSDRAILIFGLVTSGLLSFWLQADAQRAFAFARKNGFIKSGPPRSGTVAIADNCPKRWLVVLYIDLHPVVPRAD